MLDHALLTRKEARAYLRCGHDHLRGLVNSGALPVVLRGNRQYFLQSDLDAYLQRARQIIQPLPALPLPRSANRVKLNVRQIPGREIVIE